MKTISVRWSIPVACLCGFLSGIAGMWVGSRLAGGGAAGQEGVVRARRIELIGAGGRTRGVWEVNDRGTTTLGFMDDAGNTRVWLVYGDGSQALVFKEPDGRLRASLAAHYTGMSALYLGDQQREARVTLGALSEGDVPSAQPPESWGLALHGPGAHQDYMAAYVKGTPRSGKEESRIVLRQGSGAVWTAP